jgi:hypothetical protein
MLAPGCAPNRSATRTSRRFDQASPKSAPLSSVAAQLTSAISIILHLVPLDLSLEMEAAVLAIQICEMDSP